MGWQWVSWVEWGGAILDNYCNLTDASLFPVLAEAYPIVTNIVVESGT